MVGRNGFSKNEQEFKMKAERRDSKFKRVQWGWKYWKFVTCLDDNMKERKWKKVKM